MRKRDELSNPNSCMNRARDNEWTFVLLGRDKAAPVAVRAWIEERIRLGKNKREDMQIVEAEGWIKAALGDSSHASSDAPAMPKCVEALKECVAVMEGRRCADGFNAALMQAHTAIKELEAADTEEKPEIQRERDKARKNGLIYAATLAYGMALDLHPLCIREIKLLRELAHKCEAAANE